MSFKHETIIKGGSFFNYIVRVKCFREMVLYKFCIFLRKTDIFFISFTVTSLQYFCVEPAPK